MIIYYRGLKLLAREPISAHVAPTSGPPLDVSNNMSFDPGPLMVGLHVNDVITTAFNTITIILQMFLLLSVFFFFTFNFRLFAIISVSLLPPFGYMIFCD